MLVKVLSFIVSLFGTKRYKPILLACATLIVSLASISALAIFNKKRESTSANTSTQSNNVTREVIDARTPGKRAAHNENSAPSGQNLSPDTPVASSGSTGTTPTSPAKQGSAPANPANPDITLSTTAITLSKQSNLPVEVIATVPDGTNMQWAVDVDKSGLRIQKPDILSGARMVFGFTADSETTPQTYKVTIRANDPTQRISLTKTITITVTE